MNDTKGLRQTALFPNSTRSESINEILKSISAEFEVAMGSPERVRVACLRLRERLGSSPSSSDIELLSGLFPLISKRVGAVVTPVFDMFDEFSLTVNDPWPLLEGMLAVRDGKLLLRALKRALALTETGSFLVDLRASRFLAGQVEKEDSLLGKPEYLAVVGKIILHLSAPPCSGQEDPLTSLYLKEDDSRLRRLAARIMDLNGEPAADELAKKILGREAHQFLAPYLAFTRATHTDLLCLVPISAEPPPAVAALRKAEAFCGKRLLCEVIAELGWRCVNFGLEVRKFISITIGDSFPLMVFPGEAHIFETIEGSRRSGEYYLFVAHGGLNTEGRKVSEDEPTSRFRSYNLVHSDILADILSTSPLTCEKVRRILDKMDRVVFDFIALFSSHTEECSILPSLYRELRERVVVEIEKDTSDIQMSAEVTRLVQMFEDPKSLSEVNTLHGLKRYLHQRGLQLGFKLVESSRATNRTVNLVTASPKRILNISRCFRYADFEADTEVSDQTHIPYPVRIAVEGFSRQLLHGQGKLPDVKIFCYGNEVHYYLSFMNHPVFLRIDYSPPLRGGMIDLEYYGVSKNELDFHPNLSLDYIQQFFRQLDYDFQAKMTHIHARYDKESALDLGDLCDKAETLFRLVPYLMEIDWVIGFLNLSDESRKVVVEAWVKFFCLWGVLPLNQILTRDRQGILISTKGGHTRDQDVVWSGKGQYCDRFSTPLPSESFSNIQSTLNKLGLEIIPLPGDLGPHTAGQILIEKLFLCPLREAIAVGEIVKTPHGFHRSPQELFRKEHEAERFAEILSSGKEVVASSASLAKLVAPLEDTLRFQTNGSLNGYEVQRAPLALFSKTLYLYVLRDSGGIIRFALFAQGETLFLRRCDESLPWYSNGSVDVFELASLLRLSNYLPPGVESMHKEDLEKAENIRTLFLKINPKQAPRPLPGERVVMGLKASPGRAIGTVLFGTEGRSPEDFNGAILVAPSVRPEDNTFFYHSSGIISTGGGILSHAGLTAIQFKKPALIISGKWERFQDGTLSLLYRTFEYREEEKNVLGFKVSTRSNVQRHEHFLREGDLIVLDSEEGTMRVLGQDRDAIALHENIRHVREATQRLNQAKDEKKILALRGRLLQSRHQIEKLLIRITDPMLACHVAHEVLFDEHLSWNGGNRKGKSQLLSIILDNRTVGKAARDYLLKVFHGLELRKHSVIEEIRRKVPCSVHLYEILALRLKALHLCRTIEGVSMFLRDCGFEMGPKHDSIDIVIDLAVKRRLKLMRAGFAQGIEEAISSEGIDFRLRHLVRQVQRLDQLLDTPKDSRELIARLKNKIVRKDKAIRDRLEHRRVLGPSDGGFELYPHIGWKAANLAEVERLGGSGLVPPWFVVTNHAFKEVLDAPLGKTAMNIKGIASARSPRDAIRIILSQDDVDNILKSQQIRQLWDEITLPVQLVQDVSEAYHHLNENDFEGAESEEETSEPFVAIRSSAREEDAEAAARAGEFDTFLFIRGEQFLLYYLKMAWSGLWTERAIHNRAVLGIGSEDPGGGVIIQRNARSRVSGVLQTVNVAECNLREMVINAGLGLGEGIVSGVVAADQIVVDKEENLEKGPLRFRYITSDKKEQVVFNKRAGQGTILSQTLYHQRLRPAMEYIELYELVRTAALLETVYGYPLDIEFGIEGTKVLILQARPVATFLSTMKETLQYYPLSKEAEEPPHLLPKEVPL
jgi:phosphoenolpyruvate synthase/pyruvate phosphate dikinase